MTTIPLELVPAFLAVAELGSFSAAAARLGVEKSSVSRGIARFEEAIGAQLVLRTTRKVALTDVGRAVRARLEAPFAHFDSALKDVLEVASTPRGRLQISAPADFGAVILSDVVRRFALQHPHVELDVRLGSELVDLVGSGTDIAIRIAARRLADASFKARKIGELQLGIYAAPAYVSEHGMPQSAEEVQKHPFVLFPSTVDVQLHGPDEMATLHATGRIVCNDMLFLMNLITRGAGLGVLPRFLAEDELRRGGLVQVLPRWTVDRGHIWFVTPSGRKSPRVVETLYALVCDALAVRGLAPLAAPQR